MPARKRASRQPDFLAALLRTAYLPREVPPAVTTRYFSEFAKSNFAVLKAQRASLAKTTTQYDTFTAPRIVSGRRNLALVHPLSQLNISLLITEHRAKLKDIIKSNGRSLYRISENPDASEAFEGLDFRQWDISTEQIHAECPIILKADISRFFYTVYTHSIPWAISGKERVKHLLVHNKTALNKHWSNKFDHALQGCQSRETFGIPVGPDTSRLIAEILVAGVEADPSFITAVAHRPSCRMVDDLTVGFLDEVSARKALAALRSALWKFNLQLNEQKTAITTSKVPSRDKWQHALDAFSVSSLRSSKQEADIYRLIDLTLHYCEEAKSEKPASWACRKLLQLGNTEKNFDVILNSLFRLSRDFPSCTSLVAQFLINNRKSCDTAERKTKIQSWIGGMIRSHIVHSHDFEVSWALLIAGILRIPIVEELFSFDRTPSSVVFSILGLLSERKLLKFSLSKWKWRTEFKRTGIYGENWLPYYEAVLRKWTNDKTMKAAVQGDQNLAKLLRAKVTFLEDEILDAKNIDLAGRTFVLKGKMKVGSNRGPRFFSAIFDY